MDAFDIIGPIMVGPSSSHTAGAVRIGKYAQAILGEPVTKADIYFSGSFAQTYQGHGTDKAVVAGLMGMDTDDLRIRNSLELAKQAGMDFRFHTIQIDDAHPNTVLLKISGASGRSQEVEGASLGGGYFRRRDYDIGVSSGHTGYDFRRNEYYGSSGRKYRKV